MSLSCRPLANAKAAPVEMPNASAYLVSGDDGRRLEDRFDVFDLWRADAIRGRWIDNDGNSLLICRIPRKVPGDADGETRTRVDCESRYAKAIMGPKDLEALDEAVYLLSPVEVSNRFIPRRSQRQNLAALWQYETADGNAYVYAFRPLIEGKKVADWYMVALVSNDVDAADKIDEWLDEVEWIEDDGKEKAKPASSVGGKKAAISASEREVNLLASDYRRNVINYGDWHFASASNIVVVDNMSDVDRKPFIAALTNGLPKLQAMYREALPSSLSYDVHVAAVRIFKSREEYLAYVGADMKWSAALWSPQRRELVLYYPVGGFETLLHTVWHEALHQHLDYACSMIQSPPWFNEGHAVLFEHTHFDIKGNVVFDVYSDAAQFIQNNADALAESLPTLFDMDYPEFYSGTDEERQLKYHLSWSLAYFLQVGAPNVRFQPFRDLRTDMMKAIVQTRRRDEATRIVLTDEMRKDLIAEWLAFWKRQ